jgi:hypothetical protein
MWQFVGPGPAQGLFHRIVLIEPEDVFTWSLPCAGTVGGYAWRGSRDAFYREFRRVTF